MNSRHVLAVVKKDVKTLFTNPSIIVPMLLTPLIIVLVAPIVVAKLPSMTEIPTSINMWVNMFVDNLPEGLRLSLSALSEHQRVLVVMFKYLFVPIFLIIPIVVTALLGADSLAGEKERKTLEALLYAPVGMRELWFGKLITLFVLSTGVSFLCFTIYCIVVNALTFPYFGYYLLPDGIWLVTILAIVPLVSLFSISILLIVSAKAKTVIGAQQISSLILVPVLVLLFSQMTGLFHLSTLFLALFALLLFCVNIGVFWLGIRVLKKSVSNLN